MFRRIVETPLSLRAAAEMLGLTLRAVQARIGRLSRRSPGGRELRRDGVRYVKVDGRWRVYVAPPWTSNGVPRRWCSLHDAARELEAKTETLRRRLDRNAVRDRRGVVMARVRGWLACKFGDTWRLCLDAGGGT
jgi:hypothetical protein